MNTLGNIYVQLLVTHKVNFVLGLFLLHLTIICGHHIPQKRKLSFADKILTHHGLACRWRLRSALRAEQESFSIETHPLSLIIGPYADSSELSYSYCVVPPPKKKVLESLLTVGLSSYFFWGEGPYSSCWHKALLSRIEGGFQ